LRKKGAILDRSLGARSRGDGAFLEKEEKKLAYGGEARR